MSVSISAPCIELAGGNNRWSQVIICQITKAKKPNPIIRNKIPFLLLSSSVTSLVSLFVISERSSLTLTSCTIAAIVNKTTRAINTFVICLF